MERRAGLRRNSARYTPKLAAGSFITLEQLRDEKMVKSIHPKIGGRQSARKGIRSNRFQSFMGCDRMKELLCVGKHSEWDSYPPLKIPFQDLFRFWWNRCVQQEYVVDEILEDIYEFLTEKMRPVRKEEPQMDMTLDFDQLPLFIDRTDKAA